MFPKKATSSRFLSTPKPVMNRKADAPLIISNHLFNQAMGLAIACPITNTDRKIPFHLPVPNSSSLTGFVMVEQVKSVDYRARQAKFVEKAPSALVEDVIALVDVCIK